MTYQFFLSTKKGPNNGIPFSSGFERGDELSLVYSGEIENRPHKVICEVLFERFNIDVPSDYHNRPMNPGDVIILDNCAYSCEAQGFHRILMPEGLGITADDEGKVIEGASCPLCKHTPIYKEAAKVDAPHVYFCHACSRGFDHLTERKSPQV